MKGRKTHQVHFSLKEKQVIVWVTLILRKKKKSLNAGTFLQVAASLKVP